MYYSTTCQSPLGVLTLASDGQSLVGLWLAGQKYFGAGMLDQLTQRDDLPIFATTKNWLEQYFAGQNLPISHLNLNPQGSQFRKQVWDILCQIPYGKTITYGDIARQIAQKIGKATMSSQAVGNAVGHNPISIIIPCHRVVGVDGSLTGFAAGIETKAKLLQLEKN